MSLRVTVVLSVLLALLIGAFLAAWVVAIERVAMLETPNRSAIRYLDRVLQADAAVRRLPASMRWVWFWTGTGTGTEADAREWAVDAYDEVLAHAAQETGDVPLEKVRARREAVAGGERVREPGRGLYGRVFLYTLAYALPVLAGLGVLLAWVLRSRRWPVLADGLVAPPWSVGEGYAVAVRALAIATGVLLALWLLPFPMIVDWATLLASVGLILLIQMRLLRPRGLRLADAFGLRVGRERWRAVAGVALALFAVEQGGGAILVWIAELGGLSSHWTEGLDETLLWAVPGRAAWYAVDAVAWAPLFEEIGFRGLVYVTLRFRLRPWPAALLGGLAFSAVHLYTWPGFFAIWWSGFVWAVAYEKTRSLWPCILCHALHNLLWTSSYALVYR